MGHEDRRSDTIGRSPTRIDAVRKVTGRARYADDIQLPGLLHAALTTSPHAHADLHEIRLEAALAAPGVHAVLTGHDVPGENMIGNVTNDQPLFATERARFIGDRLAIVVAETAELARSAARLVEIDASPLPVVTDPVEALAPNAPKVHEVGNLLEHKRVRRGDVDAGFAEADVIVDETFRTGYQEHAYLEPHGVVVTPEPEGGVTIQGCMQAPFYVQKAVARVLGVPLAHVRVIQTETGGAFGGKEDYPSEPAACAAVAAVRTGRPVKLTFDRSEDMTRSSKRHRMVIRERIGAKKDGTITAAHIELWVDVGAYDGLSRIVAERANVSALGPYRCPNVRVDTYVVYTNNLFGGAFRGFGTPQTTFASESCLDILAERVGLGPLEIRRRNLLAEGDETISSQRITESAPARECMEAAAARSDFEAQRVRFDRANAKGGPVRRGIGVANLLYGCCLHAGGQHMEGSSATVHLRADTSVVVAIGGAELGQGAYTIAAQCAARELGVPIERVRVLNTDTAIVADSGPTVASRTTVMSGNAVIDAARRVRERLVPAAAELLGGIPVGRVRLEDDVVFDTERPETRLSLPDLVNDCYRRKIDLSSNGWYAPPRKRWDNDSGQGEAYSVYTFGTHIAEVEVDLLSGQTRVVRITAAQDVGRVVHKTMLEGQVEGGVTQGMGWAIMEDLKLDRGVPLNPNFTDYLIPTSLDAPEVDIVFVEDPYSSGPYGAKGIGEPSLIPTAAAIAAAVRHAIGFPIHELPLTPERVLLALDKAGVSPF